MIFSSVNARTAGCAWPKAIKKALNFLNQPGLADLAAGRYEIDGDNVFALVQIQNTDAPDKKNAETHYNYIDLQYLIAGEERQGYALLHDGVRAECHPERDLMYYSEVNNENFITLQPGDFTIYFTNDIHRPNCAVSQNMEIKKVVIKILEKNLYLDN